jgi:hypothetical protein
VPDDSISVVIGADVSGLTAGMKQAGTVVASTATQVKESFQSVAQADAAVSKTVNSATAEVVGGFVKMKTGGIFAFDALRAKVIESTAEVGRLRAEILETDDAGKLEKLNAQLARARAEMSAARTEMRALGLESRETTEKMNLFGEAVGVRIPGELGRLLGRIPGVQTAMAAAFQVGVVLFFISMISEAIDKIDEMTKAIGGFGKEAQKSYQEALDYNTKMVLQSIELKEKLGEIATVGKQGVAKYAQEVRNSTEAGRAQAEELGRVNRELQKSQDLVTELAKKKAIDSKWITLEGIKDLNEEMEKAEGTVQRLSRERDELEGKLRIRPVTTGTRSAEEHERERDEIIKNNEAKINAEREYNDSLITYEMAEYKRRHTLGEISLEQEISLLQNAERRKLDLEEEAYRKLRALKLQETTTATGQPSGKNVTPEIVAMDEKITQSRVTTNQKINELDEQLTTGVIRRTKETTDAEIAANTKITESQLKIAEQEEKFALSQSGSVKEAESAAASLIKTKTSLFEAQFKSVEDRAAVLTKSLSAEQQPTAKLGTSEFAQQLESIKTLRPEIYAQLLALNAQEIELRNQLAAAVVGIENEKAKKVEEIQAKSAEIQLALALTTSNRQLEAYLKSDNDRLAHHQIMLGKWQADELAALNNWYAQQLTALTRAERAIEASLGKESQEYKRLKNQETELDQQYAIKSQQINQKIADSWQQITTRMSQTFTSSVNSIVLGQQKIGQAAMHIGQSLELYIIDQGIKKVVTTYGTQLLQMLASHSSFLASLLGIQTAGTTAQLAVQTAGNATQIAEDKTKQVAEVSTNAGEAAAGAFASVMEAVPFPENVATAPGVAASAAAQTLAFGFAFEKGGIVPGPSGRAVPIVAHAQEMVLPAHISTGLDSMIRAGGVARPLISPAAGAVLGSHLNSSVNNSPQTSSSSISNKTMHNHIHVEVHNNGGQMGHEDIVASVKKGLRSGALKLAR